MPGYQEQTSQQLALLPHQHDFLSWERVYFDSAMLQHHLAQRL
ncbi:hypothetical protein J450_05115 [Mannheimia haemolytica D171]|nr:hypothetical protein J450_05115 [Mannheimia haemolytica D171]